MKSVFAFGASLVAAALLVTLAPACSSTTTTPAGTPPDQPDPPITQCDPTKCAAGNECVAMDGDLKCRKPCASNVDPATSCPPNFFCAAANEPSTIPPGCTKVAVATSKTICGALSTSSGTRLSAYSCVDVKPTGCVAAGAAGNYCCNEAPAEQVPNRACVKTPAESQGGNAAFGCDPAKETLWQCNGEGVSPGSGTCRPSSVPGGLFCCGAFIAKPVCVKQFRDVAPGPKQWGAACNPTKGLDTNDDCDVANGFFCYGNSPADAGAYCTRYTCTADRECAGGFSCATINVAPNVTTGKRTYHETTTACLRRDYGAPCKADLDCPPLVGRTQHCVLDDNSAGFCSPECVDSKNCNLEATCRDSGGVKTCYPRAGTTVGDGTLCSPCRNDANCGDDGACVKGEYSTERFCAKKSAAKCTATSKSCPPSSKPGVALGCAVQEGEASPLDNYCYGLYEFGTPGPNGGQPVDLGCYTPAR